MDTPQAKFDGWAVVDVMGHQRYVGYVTTEAYGAAVLFRIDVPALEARTFVTKRPGSYGHRYVPAGTTVEEGPVEGYSKLVGAGSIYTITPCTRDAAMKAVEEMQLRPLMNVALPPERALLPAEDGPYGGEPSDPDDEAESDDDDDDDDGGREDDAEARRNGPASDDEAP